MLRFLILLLFALPASAQLDASKVVNHPGRWAGDYAAAAEDLLAELEADPGSPFAATAYSEIEDLASLADLSLDADRLHALFERTTDPVASRRVGRLLMAAIRRTRFQDEVFALEGDLWEMALRRWWVLGPYGPLDHPAPLHLPADEDSPEVELRAGHPSHFGQTLGWRALRRSPGQFFVQPALGRLHRGSGVLYLRSHPEFHGPHQLELHLGGTGQVWFNGEKIFELTVRGTGEQEERFVLPVHGNGINELLIRVPNQLSSALAVRVLNGAGDACVKTWNRDKMPRPVAITAAHSAPSEEPPAAGLERAVWALEQVHRGRPDVALAAVVAPESEAERAAWLRVRFEALVRSAYMPAEVQRRKLLEVEKELEAAGLVLPEVLAQRTLRLINEDKPTEAFAALAELDQATQPTPTYANLRVLALGDLDGTGWLALDELRSLRVRYPDSAQVASILAARLEQEGDPLGALPHWRAALRTGGDDPALQERALSAMARAGGESLAEAYRWTSRWANDRSAVRRARELHELVLRAGGDDEGLEEFLTEEVKRAAADDRGPRRALANFLLSHGRAREARTILAKGLRAAPGDHSARATLARLGASHAAERFFQTFAPDRSEALAAVTGEHDASIAEALDSGLIYLFPDGSSHERFHTITLALDRKGTELLHTERVAEHARLAQVLKADGRVLEPSEVAGQWVMPFLEPGDAVELVWDQFTAGLPGSPPNVGWWRFTSFEKPFIRSRYVIYVPDGLPGELRPMHFDGEMEEFRYEDGTVYVMLAKDRKRQEEEPLRPSYQEILPWVQYGGDRPSEYARAVWTDRVQSLTWLPSDLRAELEAIVSGLEGGTDVERARTLYDLVTSHVLDFRGSAVAAQVWPTRRGNPLLLLAALFELAEVEFEYGVLETGVSPELDAEPVRAFAGEEPYLLPLLRIAGDTWILSPQGRGETFGQIPADLAGAAVLLLSGERANLPRAGLEDAWDQHVSITFTVDGEGAAEVQGTLRITTAQGPLLRNQLSQLGANQRGGAARNIAGQLVPGIDLMEFDFPGLAEHGAPFEMSFTGSVPALLRVTGDSAKTRLPIPPTGFATGLGSADRRWPLALRFSQRQFTEVTYVSDAWRMSGEGKLEDGSRSGFDHRFELTPTETGWTATRSFLVRGAMVAPDEMATFLSGEQEMERELTAEIELERVE